MGWVIKCKQELTYHKYMVKKLRKELKRLNESKD